MVLGLAILSFLPCSVFQLAKVEPPDQLSWKRPLRSCPVLD